MKVIKAAVVTVSDTRSEADDSSGDRLVQMLRSEGIEIAERSIVTDGLLEIREALCALAEREDINLILTTGGTGLAPRDNMPEATRAVIEREAPGIAEAMRRETSGKTPMSILSRGVCGIRGRTLIINLPGSPRGVEECFEVLRPVLAHAVQQVTGHTDHEK